MFNFVGSIAKKPPITQIQLGSREGTKRSLHQIFFFLTPNILYVILMVTYHTVLVSFGAWEANFLLRFHVFCVYMKIFSSKEEGEQKESKGDQAKELLAKYGGAYLATSITLSLISFSLCYALISAGVDVQALLQKVN